MQGNYVKLLHPQVRDLGKCDGRGPVLGSPSRKPHTDFHTMSGVLVSSVIKSSQAHPTHVSALSGRAIKTRIRAVMRHRRREAAATDAVFPSPFDVPAFASRVILFPLRN